MARVTNNSPRAIHLAGVMLVPGVETEVPDSALELKGFQRLFEADEIIVDEGKKKSGNKLPAGGGKPAEPKTD